MGSLGEGPVLLLEGRTLSTPLELGARLVLPRGSVAPSPGPAREEGEVLHRANTGRSLHVTSPVMPQPCQKSLDLALPDGLQSRAG